MKVIFIEYFKLLLEHCKLFKGPDDNDIETMNRLIKCASVICYLVCNTERIFYLNYRHYDKHMNGDDWKMSVDELLFNSIYSSGRGIN